jgi:hypothetical protein
MVWSLEHHYDRQSQIEGRQEVVASLNRSLTQSGMGTEEEKTSEI